MPRMPKPVIARFKHFSHVATWSERHDIGIAQNAQNAQPPASSQPDRQPARSPASPIASPIARHMLYCAMLYCAMVHGVMVYCVMVHSVMVHSVMVHSVMVWCVMVWCPVTRCIMVRDGGPEGLGSASYSYGGVAQTFFLLANTSMQQNLLQYQTPPLCAPTQTPLSSRYFSLAAVCAPRDPRH